MDVRRIAAELEFGWAPARRVVLWATDALGNGSDSPSLRILAGLSDGDSDEAGDLFIAALKEMDIRLPDSSALRDHLVRCVAEDVVGGRMTPRVGCERIGELFRLRQHRPAGAESRMEDLCGLLQDPGHYGVTTESVTHEILEVAAELASTTGDSDPGAA